MRGSNTLFADIFEPSIAPLQKKGRNKDLNALRNECLIDRYFFYGSQRMSYTAILDKLGREFFISTYTIPDIVGRHVEQLKRLRDASPAKAYYKEKWPHLNW